MITRSRRSSGSSLHRWAERALTFGWCLADWDPMSASLGVIERVRRVAGRVHHYNRSRKLKFVAAAIEQHGILSVLVVGVHGNSADGLDLPFEAGEFDPFMYSDAFAGGGFQVAQRVGDVVLAGCHCTYAERFGHFAHYSSFSDTRTAHKLVMAYDAATGHLIESFTPDVTSPRDGTWAVALDTNECLYLGGDFNGRGIEAGLGGWAGGFGKLCTAGWLPPDADQADTQPASVPQGLSTQSAASSVSLLWGASSDNVGIRSYLVYRGGAYLGWTDAATTTSVDDTAIANTTYSYNFRAVDLADNRSANSDSVQVTVS